MSCGDEQYEKQPLVYYDGVTRKPVMSVLGDPVVIDREYLMRDGQRVYTGCNRGVVSDLNPGVVTLGELGADCTEENEACCDCAYIPAMHADGTTPTSIGAGGIMIKHPAETTPPVDLEFPDPETDNGGGGCQKCEGIEPAGTLSLVAYQRLEDTSERYVFSTVPTCKPYPLFRHCDIAQGAAWWGSEIDPCAFRNPTVTEMQNGAPWLRDFSSILLGTESYDDAFNDGYIDRFSGCYRGYTVCQDYDYTGEVPVPIDPMSALFFTDQLFPNRRAAASLIIEITYPTGTSAAPVGGSIAIRWICKSWMEAAFNPDNPPYGLVRFSESLYFANGDGGCASAKALLDAEGGSLGWIVAAGISIPRSWKATTGDASGKLLATDWEWDDKRCSWRLRKNWSAKLIEVPTNAPFNFTEPPPGWPGCLDDGDCDGVYTVTPGDEDGCDYNVHGNAGASTYWRDTSFDFASIPVSTEPNLQTRKWGLPIVISDVPTITSNLGNHPSVYHCIYKSFTVSL